MRVGVGERVKWVCVWTGRKSRRSSFEWQPVLLALITIKLPLAANDPARWCASVLLALAARAFFKLIPL